MSLANLQTEFQNIILAPECSGADWVADSKIKLSPKQRLGIYYNAYRLRLVDVLLDNFEHTSMYLGEEWFYKLGYAYVQSHFSTHHNIAKYGQQFPDFLAKQLPKDLEVSELAFMDWTLRRAFDGENSNIFDNQALQTLVETHGADTCLSPVPTLSVVTHSFNTVDIWHAIDNEETPPSVEKLESSTDVLFWRKGYSPHFRSLTAIESTALKYLLAGDTINQIGESLTTEFPHADVSNEFGLMLQRWISDEVLAR